jgi:hypothetical protein
MARLFDGTNDEIRTSIGGIVGTGAITMAAIMRRNSTVYNGVIGLHTSGGTATYSIEIADGTGSLDFSGNVNWSPGITVVNADGWVLIAVTKASGTVAPRGHKYVYSSDTWAHNNSASNTANGASVSGGTVRFGEWQDVDDFAGDIAIAGVWDRVLTDAEIENLAFTKEAWHAAAPAGLWLFDQQAVAQSVSDLTGGGANQSTITGTALSTNSVPIFNYTDGPVWTVLTRVVAGGGTTLTPDPVTVPIVVAAPSLALVLAPAAVTVPVTVAAQTLAVTLTATPVAVPITVAQPTLALGVAPAPVTIPLQIAAPSLAMVLAPAATAIPLVVPTPVAAVGGSETLTPAPVTIPLVVPAPAMALVLAPAALTVPIAVVQPTVEVGGTVTLTPDPIPVPLALPAPTLTLALAPAPVTAPVVVVTPTLALAFVLQPAAVGIPIQVVALGLALTMAPEPVVITLVLPLVTIPGAVVLGPGTVHGGTQLTSALVGGTQRNGALTGGEQLVGSARGGPSQ